MDCIQAQSVISEALDGSPGRRGGARGRQGSLPRVRAVRRSTSAPSVRCAAPRHPRPRLTSPTASWRRSGPRPQRRTAADLAAARAASAHVQQPSSDTAGRSSVPHADAARRAGRRRSAAGRSARFSVGGAAHGPPSAHRVGQRRCGRARRGRACRRRSASCSSSTVAPARRPRSTDAATAAAPESARRRSASRAAQPQRPRRRSSAPVSAATRHLRACT